VESSSELTRLPANRIRSQILSKIVVSLLLGGAAFLISSAIDSGVGNQTILSIGVSVFVSGLVLLIQFLVDVDHRLDALTREVRDLVGRLDEHSQTVQKMIATEFAAINQQTKNEFVKIQGQFTKINEATELFGLVEASALKTDAMTQLVKHATTIERGNPPTVFEFAQEEIARLSRYLKALGLGADVTYEGEDRDWLLGLAAVASHTIDATSLTTVDAGGRGFVDGGLWTSDLGRRYLEAQKEAIERGVTIRRIFIIDRRDLQNHDDFIKVLEEHIKIGVNVRILDPRTLTFSRQTSVADFIVIDGVLVYRSTVITRVEEGSHPVIDSTRLVTNRDEVVDRIVRFRELWTAADEYRPSAATPRPPAQRRPEEAPVRGEAQPGPGRNA
jgi:hypothetical protein